jgi:hypothetical protein
VEHVVPSTQATVSLAESSNGMRNASPVFIMGLGRSGTSLLYRTMQKHPAFHPRTINLQETRLMARLPWAFRFDDESPRQLVRFMLKDSEHYHAFLEETRHLRRLTLLTSPVNVPLRGRTPTPLWRAQGLHLVARSYLWHAWAARGSQRLVEKTPGHVMYLDKPLRREPSVPVGLRHPAPGRLLLLVPEAGSGRPEGGALGRPEPRQVRAEVPRRGR